MQIRSSAFFGVLAALTLAAAPGAQATREVRHEVVIEVPHATDRVVIEDRLAREGCKVIEELPALGLWLVKIPPSLSVDAAVARFAAVRGVGFAEPNGTGEGGGFVPNDTYFPEQWPLENTGQSGGRAGADIDALRGWELTRGSPSVIVAVLDSGIVAHNPEFVGRLRPGFDFVNEDDDPLDDHGHGTMVSGLLAANANNGFGLAGVDHACTLLPVKVLDRNNAGTTFDLAQGLVYAADAGARVISMSLINYPETAGLRNAIQYARDAGCVLVACAGNGGIGDADVSYPGRSPLTISVGATTRRDARASFSGTGAHLDLVAPGKDVPATVRPNVDDWVAFSGCSAATPMVSGIAALLLSIDPTLTHDEVRALLEAGAEDQVGPPEVDTPGRDDFFGNGRVNLFRSLCGLDRSGPEIVAPSVLRVDCPTASGIAGDDPSVTAALAEVSALDDLDPAPALEFIAPAFLPFEKTVAVAFTARDACGHETQRNVDIVAVDTRAPELALALKIAQLTRDERLLPVGLRTDVRDACDRSPALTLAVYADEPAPARGEPAAEIDAKGRLFLRGACDAAGDGRVYLCLVRATDASGNAATRCVTAVVALNSSPAALADVRAQAESAARDCELTGRAPTGFHLLVAAQLPRASAPSSASR